MGTEPGRERAGKERRDPFRRRRDAHPGKSAGLRRRARLSAPRELRKIAGRSRDRRGRAGDAPYLARRADHRRSKSAQACLRREAVRACLARRRSPVRACAENKVTLAIGYNWRFQPALKEIKSMLGDGRLGKLLHMEGNFCGPGVYRYEREHWRQSREEGPAGGMTGRGVHLVDAMICLSGRIESVYARSSRAVRDFGLDDTTSMLFRFQSGATGYLGTVIATAETWRLQVFGSNGRAEVGDVEHLTTWQLKLCTVDRENLHLHRRPQIMTFPETSTERAELEHFAKAAMAGCPLAVADGDEVHGVAVLDAVLKSTRGGSTIRIA